MARTVALGRATLARSSDRARGTASFMARTVALGRATLARSSDRARGTASFMARTVALGRATAGVMLLLALAGCEEKVRVTIRVKTADAGVIKTSTAAVP